MRIDAVITSMFIGMGLASLLVTVSYIIAVGIISVIENIKAIMIGEIKMKTQKIKNTFKEIGKGCLSFLAFMLGVVVVALFDMLLDGFLLDNDVCLVLMQLVIVAGQLVVMVRLRCKTMTAILTNVAFVIFHVAIGGEQMWDWLVFLFSIEIFVVHLINEIRREKLDKYRTSDGGYMGGSAIAQLHELERTAVERAAEYYAEIKRKIAKEIFEEIYEDCFDQFGYINYDKLAELKKKYTEGE
jgi:hypothetical protein